MFYMILNGYIYIYIHIYIYIYCHFLKHMKTFPVEIVRAQAREHLTHARARCASTDRRARETREQIEARARGARASQARANKLSKSGFGELICDLESLFARAESLFARARVSDGVLALLAHLARRASICSRVSRARLSLLARLARAHVKCSRARAAHPAAGEAAYMNSYVFESSQYIYMVPSSVSPPPPMGWVPR